MIEVIGGGLGLPQRVVDNAELERTMQTTAEFVLSRTGIETRRYVSPGENNSTLALRAINAALADAAVGAADIDMMIVSTLSPDYHDPSQACLIQGMLPEMRNIPVFDIRAQCSGFLYGLSLGQSVILSGGARKVLIVCSEVLSRRVRGDLADRNVAVLVGDGAAAVVVQRADAGSGCGLVDVTLGASGAYHDTLRTVRPGVAAEAFLPNGSALEDYQFRMDGRRLWEHAVATMEAAVTETLARLGITMDEVDRVICHQPNVRMIEALAKRFEPHGHKFLYEGRIYGNMASASIAVGWVNQAKVAPSGSVSLLVAYGAGATWGTAIYRH